MRAGPAKETFRDRLSAELTLSIGSSSVSVAAGDLKRFELDLAAWGFEGRATFYVVCTDSAEEDSLFDGFVGTDPITVEMTVKRTFDEVSEEATTLTLHGLVIEKSVAERALEQVSGAPVLTRRYEIRFMDRGQALWRSHRPTKLYVDKTLGDLIDDNTPDGVTVTHGWSVGTTTKAVLSLGLDGDRSGASFYDYLFWLLHKENAALLYDLAEDAYSIVDAKPEGEAEELRQAEVASLEVCFPTVRRDAVTVLNAYTDAATRTKASTNEDGVQGLRTDFLIRSSIEDDIDARSTLEAARAGQREPELRVEFASYPAVPLLPSMQVALDPSWGESVYPSGNTYRVVTARITAAAVSQEAADDNGADSNRYELTHALQLELASDPVFHHPPFLRPSWPVHVEGKVLSETGETADETYQSYQDETTSLDQYKIQIPLWEDQTVVLPYAPGALSGHFYFPLLKGARVLVALGFDEAAIVACLDWRTSARLPLDTQGDHLLVGKSATSETSIQHAYVDALPVLTIERTSESDVQVITVSEGTVRFEVK